MRSFKYRISFYRQVNEWTFLLIGENQLACILFGISAWILLTARSILTGPVSLERCIRRHFSEVSIERRNQYCLNIYRHRLISRNDEASLAWAFYSYTSVNSRREQSRPGFSNVLVFFKQSWSKSRLISHQSESISFIKVSKPFVLSRQLQTRNVRKLVIRKKMFVVLFVSLRVSFIYQT